MGFTADVVERFIAAVQRKRDFLGFADILGCKPGVPGVLAVQATSLPHVGDRLKRCKARGELRTWLAAGNAFEVWGWTFRAGRWTCKRVAVTGDDLADVVLVAPPRRRKRLDQGSLFDGPSTNHDGAG